MENHLGEGVPGLFQELNRTAEDLVNFVGDYLSPVPPEMDGPLQQLNLDVIVVGDEGLGEDIPGV